MNTVHIVIHSFPKIALFLGDKLSKWFGTKEEVPDGSFKGHGEV